MFLTQSIPSSQYSMAKKIIIHWSKTLPRITMYLGIGSLFNIFQQIHYTNQLLYNCSGRDKDKVCMVNHKDAYHMRFYRFESRASAYLKVGFFATIYIICSATTPQASKRNDSQVSVNILFSP